MYRDERIEVHCMAEKKKFYNIVIHLLLSHTIILATCRASIFTVIPNNNYVDACMVL